MAIADHKSWKAREGASVPRQMRTLAHCRRSRRYECADKSSALDPSETFAAERQIGEDGPFRTLTTSALRQSDACAGQGRKLPVRYVRIQQIVLKKSALGRLSIEAGWLCERGLRPHAARGGAPTGISFAIFLRFWAVAARRNSSRAPHGPRSLKRSSLRMRFRCANSISTFFRSRREVT